MTATTLADAKKQGATLAWGNFLQVTVNFLIIAAVLFLAVKIMAALKRRAYASTPAPVARPAQEVLLEEIRDLLAKRT